MSDRQCGQCAECCDVMAVGALDKPRHQPCQHMRRGTRRCAVYADRPSECQTFACLWLRGLVPRRLRPDSTGVVLVEDAGRVVMHEVRPGRAKTVDAWISMREAVDATGLPGLVRLHGEDEARRVTVSDDD